MENREFNREIELHIIGEFKTVGTWYGYPFPKGDQKKLATPITPKNNIKLFYERKHPYWVPNSMADCNVIYPDIIPDNLACGFDGGIDSFGVDWVSCGNELPSMVKPGNPKLKHIADWRTLKWPDIDEWDWEGSAQLYKDLDTDRLNRGIMLTGMFERMISLLDFGNAAISLIKDQESVIDFLNKLTDYNLSILEHYKKYYNVDEIVFHDDWGAQNAPIFSRETAQALFIPQLKKLTDKAHELKIYFVFHSCGSGSCFIPDMIDAGVDMWQLQINANPQILKTVEKYGGKILFEGYDEIASTLTDEQVKNQISRTLKTYCSKSNFQYAFNDLSENRDFDLRKFLYTESRKVLNPR
jgi:hypothetical protein